MLSNELFLAQNGQTVSNAVEVSGIGSGFFRLCYALLINSNGNFNLVIFSHLHNIFNAIHNRRLYLPARVLSCSGCVAKRFICNIQQGLLYFVSNTRTVVIC